MRNVTTYDADLASLARALGHPARVTILRLILSGRASTCGELVSRLPLAQSTVSQHLAQLRKAGLLTATPDGQHVRYAPNSAQVRYLATLVGGLAASAFRS